RMTWRNRSDRTVSKVYLHLYLNAFDGPGSTFATEQRRFAGSGHSRGGGSLQNDQRGWIKLDKLRQNGLAVSWRFVHPDHGPATDHSVVELDLPQAIAAHATLTLDINFHEQLPRVVARTGWWGKFHLVAQWFPKIGVLELPGERGATTPRWNVHEFHFHSEFYADFGSYDVTLTVPKGYTVGAVGEEIGKPVAKDGKSTYHFIAHDVEDFAWLAAPGYQVMTDQWQGKGSPLVTLRVIYPPEYAASAKPVMQATRAALEYFSDTLGPYPYATVTAVVPPYNADAAGGMEYPTFFTTEGFAKVPPDSYAQYLLNFATIHEFGHGYFMGILGSNEFEEPMLDEGLNEYWDDRMLVHQRQRVQLTPSWLRWLGVEVSLPPFVYEHLLVGLMMRQPLDPLDANSWDRVSNASYASVYSRTAVAMHDLEQRLGSKLMSKAMRAYYQRWKFRHPSAADLRASLIEASGQPALVTSLFANQVYGTQQVDDRVLSFSSVKQVDDKTWLTRVTVVHDGANVPQLLQLRFADGSSKRVPWNDGQRWKRFVWHTPSQALSVQLDPQHQVLLDANKLNDSDRIKADGSLSRRWSADLAAVVNVFYALLVTL
ncbi:MAG: M1 family metallopeptidase, partial [Xanthomonadales bacterium]|nr:M1 family metallopeptidase [Xanthomonadales bacterium]